MSSGGEKIEALGAKTLGLVAAALVAITLLLTAPLASVASARAEARAGGAVAIAGDCDVASNNDENTGEVEDNVNENGDEAEDNVNESPDEAEENVSENAEEDLFGLEVTGDQTQDESDDSVRQTSEDDATPISEDDATQISEDNASQAQYEDENDPLQDEDIDDQVQDGADGAVVARAGDTVAIAGGDCDADTDSTDTDSTDTDSTDTDSTDTDSTDTEESNAEDFEVEDDEEILDLLQQDGETQGGSNVTALPLALDSSNRQSEGDTTARRKGFSLGGEFGTNKPGEKRRTENSVLRQDRSKSSAPSSTNGPLLRKGELGELGEARRYEPKRNAVMTLSIRALGLYDAPVRSANTRKAFDRGVVHAPDTALPWDATNQKNVFLAGHRLGPPEEDGRLIFYDLDELEPGDEIVLKDRRGQSYKYRVRELFKVGPKDGWVADTLVGRDLLTLQTYTLPDSKDRLIVRADRI